MSKEKEVSKSIEKQEQTMQVAGLSKNDLAALSMLDEANEGMELTAEYLSGDTMEEGEERRLIYTGAKKMKSMDNPEEMVDAVTFIDSRGKRFITALTVIVGSCLDLSKGQAVKILYMGKERGKNKLMYSKFRVTELDLKLEM